MQKPGAIEPVTIEFEHLMVCFESLLGNRVEEEAFLKYVQAQQNYLVDYIETLEEQKRLVLALETARKDIRVLESKVNCARVILTSERQKRKQQELLKEKLIQRLSLLRGALCENPHFKDELQLIDRAMSNDEDLDKLFELDSDSSSVNVTQHSEQDLDEANLRYTTSYKKHHLDLDEEPMTKKRRPSVLESPIPPDTPTAETSAQPALNGFTDRSHNFVTKNLIMNKRCISCQKKLRFGNIAFRCTECHATTHASCRFDVPLPCIPMSTPSKKLVGTISDYAPVTPPKVPALVVYCVHEIEQRGLKEVGIYRVPGNQTEAHALKDRFLKCRGAPSMEHLDVHTICSCLKDFLRNLEDCLIPQSERDTFAAILHEDNKCEKLCSTISSLPEANRHTLAYVVLHLQRVAFNIDSKMPVTNLATVFGPTIVGQSDQLMDPVMEAQVSNAIMEELLMLPSAFWNELLGVAATPESSETPRFAAATASATQVEVTPLSVSKKPFKRLNTPTAKKRFFRSPLCGQHGADAE